MPSTYQSITVSASADEVWSTLRNFHDLSWAPDVIEQCERVGDRAATQVGAQRVLNGVFEETLQAISDADRTLQYSIDDGPSPVSSDEVSNYIGQIDVRPVSLEGKTFVEWSSSWDAETKEAVEFCHTIYVALLQALKAHYEGA